MNESVGMTKSAFERRGRLIRERERRGWSQQQVADRIGTTHLNVSRWERGRTLPGPYFRCKLCELFGKSEQELDLAAPDSGGPVYDPALPLLPATRLVGRARELSRLRQHLTDLDTTALQGMPGVGKTALAIELAHDHEIRAHFRDGILWAALGPEPHMPGLLSNWGAMLGLSSTEMVQMIDSEARGIALRHAIGSRALLLVIDDAWRIEDVLGLQVGGHRCAYLVTTRFPTIAIGVAPGGASPIQELGEDDSMNLLSMLAPSVVEREEQKVQNLVHAVGGLPLALTLMGTYLRMQAFSGQDRRVDAALGRLSDAEGRFQLSESREPGARHPSLPAGTPLSLRSIFDTIGQQLDEQARATLSACSVFPSKPHSFSEEDALIAAHCSVDTLDTLYEAGLLESAGSGRYTLHPVVADYARVCLRLP